VRAEGAERFSMVVMELSPHLHPPPLNPNPPSSHRKQERLAHRLTNAALSYHRCWSPNCKTGVSRPLRTVLDLQTFKAEMVAELGQLMVGAGMAGVLPLPTARVPVLKFMVPQTGTKVCPLPVFLSHRLRTQPTLWWRKISAAVQAHKLDYEASHAVSFHALSA